MTCKRLWIFLLAMAVLLGICPGQEKAGETGDTGKKTEKTPKKEPEPRHYVVNASIFYPLSINKSKYDSVNLNLSLFYSQVGRVKGIDLGGAVSVIKNELKGIQLAGLAGIGGETCSGIQASGLFSICDRLKGVQLAGLGNINGENSKGIQGGGIFNIAGEDFKGLEAGGIFNITGENFSGVQGSGIFNIVGENFVGIQASGIFNITGENFKGVQGVGLFNVAGGDFLGIQGAGLFNVAGGSLRGVQAACVNFTSTLSGLQVGLVNLAEKVKGVQLGLVNFAKHMEGVPVGLVNLAKGGRIRMTGWSSSVMAVNTGVKFMVKGIYSIISIGGINLYKDLSEALSYGFNYGVHFPVKRTRLFVDLDAGYMNIDNKTLFKSKQGTLDHQVVMLRGMLGVNITRKFSLFAGAGLRHLWNHGELIKQGQVRPMFIAGFEAF